MTPSAPSRKMTPPSLKLHLLVGGLAGYLVACLLYFPAVGWLGLKCVPLALLGAFLGLLLWQQRMKEVFVQFRRMHPPKPRAGKLPDRPPARPFDDRLTRFLGTTPHASREAPPVPSRMPFWSAIDPRHWQTYRPRPRTNLRRLLLRIRRAVRG